jgi:hypothetical protein
MTHLRPLNAKRWILALTFLVLCVGSVTAQSSPTSTVSSRSTSPASDDNTLKGCEMLADQLKFQIARAESAERERDGLRGMIVLYEQLVARERARGDEYLAAVKDRAKANDLDLRVDLLRQEQLVELRADRDRLLRENDKLRNPPWYKALFDPRTISAGALGFGLGRVTR